MSRPWDSPAVVAMRLLPLLAAFALAGCLSAQAAGVAANDGKDAAPLESVSVSQNDVYYTMVHMEFAWSGVVATPLGTNALEDYSKALDAEGDVTAVDATLEWNDHLDGALRLCLLRDGEAVGEVDCAQGPSPLAISWSSDDERLAPGDYTLEFTAIPGALPVGAVVASMVTGSLTMTWVLPAP